MMSFIFFQALAYNCSDQVKRLNPFRVEIKGGHFYMMQISKTAERVLSSMRGKDQSVIRALLSGQTKQEVSLATGIPQSVVSYTQKAFQAKVRAALEEG